MGRVVEVVAGAAAAAAVSNVGTRNLITPVFNVMGYGAVGDGVTDDSVAVQAADTAAVSSGGSVFFPPGKTYIIAQVRYSPNSRWFSVGTGAVLKHKAASTGPLLIYATAGSGRIELENLTFDGNKANQTSRQFCVHLTSDEVYVTKCRFINTVKVALYVNATTFGSVEKCHFSGMAEHSGVAGGYSEAIQATGSGELVIVKNYFTAGAPTLAGGAPGGVVVVNESPGFTSVTITHNTFRGIGQYASSSFLGCVDLYSEAQKSIVAFNRIYNYRYNALKLSGSGEIICTYNIIDGAAESAANQAITYQPRTHVSTTYDSVLIQGNILKNIYVGTGNNGIDIQGAAAGSTKNVIIRDNIIKDVYTGIFVQYVNGQTIIENNIIETPRNRGIQVRDMSGDVLMDSNVVKSAANSCFEAVTAVTGARFAISKCSALTSTGGYGFYFSAYASLKLTECHGESGFGGDAYLLGTTFTYVAGCTFTAQAFAATLLLTEKGNSWQPAVKHGSAAPASGVHIIGDIVYNTAAAAGGYTGWECTTAGTPGTWRPFGSIEGWVSIATAGATPSVADRTHVKLTQTGATNVTNFTGGVDGQHISVLVGDGNTTLVQGATISLRGGINVTMSSGQIVELYLNGTVWTQPL